MTKWHLKSARKQTGGATVRIRKKRRQDLGSLFLETKVGKSKTRTDRVRGGNIKIRLLSIDTALVYDPKSKKTKKAKILTVKENHANPHYVRRNIITKGAVIETDSGLAKVTSRPGQHGVINAILVEKK